MVIHSSGSQISKQEVRAYVLQKRGTLLPEEKQRWDEALLERLHPFFPSAGTAVYAYTSVRGEASTEYLIDELLKRGCRVALPRVFGREMRFFYVTDRCQLVTGEFPIVKDTTPNMMNPRLYTTSYNKPQGQQFDDTAVLSFIKLQYT